MPENTLQVEVVAADRLVWSGEATCVNARTAGGEDSSQARRPVSACGLRASWIEISPSIEHWTMVFPACRA